MRIAPKSKYSFLIWPLLWLQRRHYGEVLNPAKLWGRKPVLFLAGGRFFRLSGSPFFSPFSNIALSGVCQNFSA